MRFPFHRLVQTKAAQPKLRTVALKQKKQQLV
jgi:hypothetical protein